MAPLRYHGDALRDCRVRVVMNKDGHPASDSCDVIAWRHHVTSSRDVIVRPDIYHYPVPLSVTLPKALLAYVLDFMYKTSTTDIWNELRRQPLYVNRTNVCRVQRHTNTLVNPRSINMMAWRLGPKGRQSQTVDSILGNGWQPYIFKDRIKILKLFSILKKNNFKQFISSCERLCKVYSFTLLLQVFLY